MSSRKILIVEDNGEMRHLLKTVLETEGYKTDEADSLKGARLKIALDQSYDMILLDVSLDDGSGFDFAKEARNRYARTRICFVTGMRTLEDVKRAAEIGIRDYIVKPISPILFLDKIRKIFDRGLQDDPQAGAERFTAAEGAASILGLPIELKVELRRVSTASIEFTTGVPIKPGSSISVASPLLSAAETDGGIVKASVTSCEGAAPNYVARARITALSREQMARIEEHVKNDRALSST